MPDLSIVTQRIFDASVNPRSVNNGNCGMWAYGATLACRHAQVYSVDRLDLSCGHYFVKVGSLYYDAEAPGGVPHWSELPYCRRHCLQESNCIFESSTQQELLTGQVALMLNQGRFTEAELFKYLPRVFRGKGYLRVVIQPSCACNLRMRCDWAGHDLDIIAA